MSEFNVAAHADGEHLLSAVHLISMVFTEYPQMLHNGDNKE